MIAGGVKQVNSIARNFYQGDTKTAVMETSELLKSVGMAFIQSGIPGLNIVGGILLFSGMITNLVGEFMDTTLTKEQKLRNETEARKEKDEEILSIYQAQLAYITEMAEAGSKLYDTAEERAEAEKNAYEYMVSQNSEMQKMKGLSDEEIANQKLIAKVKKEQLETQIADLKRSLSASRDEMGQALGRAGYSYTADEWFWRMKADVEQDVKNVIAELEKELAANEAQIKAGETTVEFRKRQAEILKAVNQEINESLDLRKEYLEYLYGINQIDEFEYNAKMNDLLKVKVDEASKYLWKLVYRKPKSNYGNYIKNNLIFN